MICAANGGQRAAIVKGSLVFGRFRIPYRIYGADGPFLVCVSGAQQSMSVWKSLVTHFRGRYRVVCADLPGQGQAEILEGSPRVELCEQVEALHGLMQAVGALSDEDPVFMCGASWGGIALAAYVTAYPATADKLILGSFGMKSSASMRKVIRQGRALYAAGQRRKIGDLIVDGFGGSIPPAYKDAIRRQFANMDDRRLQSFYAHCNMVESAGDIHNFLDLRGIRAKTLIVNGEKDTILDLADIDLATNLIPDCRCVVVKDVGHFLHFEDRRVLSIYDDFLSL